MSKKSEPIPVFATHMLFELIRNRNYELRRLGVFASEGSVPPTKAEGSVNQRPEWYVMMPEVKFNATLEYVRHAEASYVGAGLVWKNIETGSHFFMTEEEFKHLMNSSIIDHGRVSGNWQIVKHGHAYTLHYQGE